MSYQAIDWAFSVGGLSPTERLVLVVLAKHHNPKFGCFPSLATLADLTGLSVRHVIRTLKALEKRQLIAKRKRWKKNQYTLELTSSGDTVSCDQVTPCHVTTSKSEVSLVTMSPDNIKGNKKIREKVKQKAATSAATEETVKKAADVIADLTKPKTSAEVHKAATQKEEIPPKALWAAWRDFNALYSPGVFVGEPKVQDLSQLKKSFQLAGAEIVAAMETCIKEWDWFVKAVKDHDGYVKGAVTYPHIGFFLKHLTVAINFHRQEMKARSAKSKELAVEQMPPQTIDSLPKSALTNDKVSPDNGIKPATLEEVMAIFGAKK